MYSRIYFFLLEVYWTLELGNFSREFRVIVVRTLTTAIKQRRGERYELHNLQRPVFTCAPTTEQSAKSSEQLQRRTAA